MSDDFIIVNTNNRVFLMFLTGLSQTNIEDILVAFPLAALKDALAIPATIQTEVNHLAASVAFRQSANVFGLRFHTNKGIKMSVEVNENFFYFSC